MHSTKGTVYKPSWAEGFHVKLTRKEHPRYAETGTIIAVLPNPSQRENNQWYDVRFESGRYGRFLQRHLQLVEHPQSAKTA